MPTSATGRLSPAVFAPIGDRCEFTKRVYCTVRLVVLSSRSPTMR